MTTFHSKPFDLNTESELWFLQLKGNSSVSYADTKITLNAGESVFLTKGLGVQCEPSVDSLGIYVVYN